MFEAILGGFMLGFYICFTAMAIAIAVNHIHQIRELKFDRARKDELHLAELDLTKARVQTELKRLG